MLLNGRNLTNLGVFRTYIEQYLKAHPMTNDDLTMMCRQLEPTSQGIPIPDLCIFKRQRVDKI